MHGDWTFCCVPSQQVGPESWCMSLLPKINMAEVTRLTRAGRLLEATALLRGRSPHDRKGAAPDEVVPEIEPAIEGRLANLSTRNYTGSAGARSYRLFVPSGAGSKRLPLVIMLHGCTQSPDDFAAGTRMDALAEEQSFIVAYPAQTKAANSSRCWNWFNAAEQVRERGEPAIIAGITREIVERCPVDPARVYVAGLSAGGAAAATLAALYPELYAAVCVHSGLACGAAKDMMSAFGAMRSGGTPGATHARSADPVPTIVFHGDHDTTVNVVNGEQVVAQSRGEAAYSTKTIEGQGPRGTTYTKTVETDRRGRAMLEHWVLHGRGHAWAGGSAKGSFTDPEGIDASREMLRFFRGHALE